MYAFNKFPVAETQTTTLIHYARRIGIILIITIITYLILSLFKSVFNLMNCE